jgi:uncharacterized repeat protein (TIGR03803 family)
MVRLLLRLAAIGLAASIGFAIPSGAATSRSFAQRNLRAVPAKKAACCADVESILYHFRWDPDTGNAADGARPNAGVTLDPSGNGVIYGTTLFGGKHEHGTVFELVPSGSGYEESVIYSFPKGVGWSVSAAPVIVDATGAIYSTTGANATNACGTVFKLTPTGSSYAATVLHHFQTGSDGCDPAWSGLYEDSGGALYGTTIGGGNASCVNEPYQTNGCGTVFKLTPSGSGTYSESFVYRFQGGTDGREPTAGLIADSGGALYGTTMAGGGRGCNCGVVFKLTPTGSGSYTERVIYDFKTYASSGPLIADANGDLFGTAVARRGGGNIVYELVPSSSEPTGYVFRIIFNQSDGRPSKVIFCSSAGALCAASFEGVSSNLAGDVFELIPPQDPSGTYSETTLFTFDGGDSGANPSSYIVYAAGALYGTFGVNGGPSGGHKCLAPLGGVFRLTAPSGSSSALMNR